MEKDILLKVEFPMTVHTGSRFPTRSGFYGLFLRGLHRPGEITFCQTFFSQRHQQWFNYDRNRRSMSGLNDRLDIVAWAECPHINPLVSDYAVMAFNQIINNKG